MADHTKPNQAVVVVLVSILVLLAAIVIKGWIDATRATERAQENLDDTYWRTVHQLEQNCTHDSLTRARDSLGLHYVPLDSSATERLR